MMTSTPEEKAEILNVADKSDRRKFRIDWRVPIPGLITALVVVVGWIWIVAAKTEAFSEVQRTTDAHTLQLAKLDSVTVQTNLDVAGLKGDLNAIKSQLGEVLQELHRQNDRDRP